MLAETYFNKVEEILDKAKETQLENVRKAAVQIAGAIENDGLLHVFGCGHSQVSDGIIILSLVKLLYNLSILPYVLILLVVGIVSLGLFKGKRSKESQTVNV